MTVTERPILLATRNAGKLRELQPLLAEFGFQSRTLHDLGYEERPEESGIEVWATFRDNALAKARHFASLAADYPVLAEDSGLCVDVLGGAPGVHSRRGGGGEPSTDALNNQRLLRALNQATDRRAAYVCYAVLVTPSAVYTGEGQTAGRILEAPSGDGGFGYDPLFWSEELQAGFGHVSTEVKAEVSHRSRAVSQLLRLYRAAGTKKR